MAKLNKITWISIFLLVPIIRCYSCSCGGWYDDDFCNQIDENSILIKASVINFENSEFMKVIILDEINLDLELPDTLIIQGGDGANCGENLSLFTVSDTLIMSLFLYDVDISDTMFLFGDCARHYLKVVNDTINEGGVFGIPYDSFIADLEDCYELTSIKESISSDVKIYPNPVFSSLKIESDEGAITSIDIFDIYGRLIYRVDTSGKYLIDIDLNYLSRGNYTVIIRKRDHVILKKIVKH